MEIKKKMKEIVKNEGILQWLIDLCGFFKVIL